MYTYFMIPGKVKNRFAAASMLLFLVPGLLLFPGSSGSPFYAGFRASRYGIEPFPGKEFWTGVGQQLGEKMGGVPAGTVWIVGEITGDNACLLNFPSPVPGTVYRDIEFLDVDQNEEYLTWFDDHGIFVWLQVEPGNAGVPDLIDIVLSRYKHHPCVKGFGVDVEWYRSGTYPEGKAVTDSEALEWNKKVTRHNANYNLFLKHWLISKMPPNYRTNLYFINDSQGFASLAEMVEEFDAWGNYFAPNPVGFQFGYEADRSWWNVFNDPFKEIGRELVKNIENTYGLFWVDFTLKEIFPAAGRSDGATAVDISKTGSQQNPAWSPDGKSLLFTRFRQGYNGEPADLFIVNPATGSTRTLVSDDSGNINLPGSTWNPVTGKIAFSSTRDPHDEIYIIDENGTPGDEIQITSRNDRVAFEPSFSPNGDWIVFESHVPDVEGNGIIYKCKLSGEKPYRMLTGVFDDCRQPNWSPAGGRILYQKYAHGQWDIWVINTDGSNPVKVTAGPGNKTDGSFSADGQYIVYSSDEGGEEFANLYIIPASGGKSTKITHYNAGYDGAPSWSPDGKQIAFESCAGDPDESSGTSIWLIDVQVPDTSFISLDKTRLNFGFVDGSSTPVSQTVYVSNGGTGTLNWFISVDAGWLTCTPLKGKNAGIVTVTVDPTVISIGQHSGTVTVSADGAANSPRAVIAAANVYRAGSTEVPFGLFSTPLHGSTVRSSVPFTGWVLDDIGIESVNIYREGESGLVYIGDAVSVEGARPDIQQAFPDYPFNYRAGWGYMLLTNFLPNRGNGTFTFHAVASDKEGNTVTLGTKTIICDNDHAVNPFGAIDTPSQGGTASSHNFVNWGWALTPQPGTIPTDGSTINVYLDGVELGHPVYNIYRSDIAGLFPGYANTSGAAGYFSLDTTAYANGVHTIYWTAKDNAGNSDGIGSRYFTIRNTNAGINEAFKMSGVGRSLEDIPIDYLRPVHIIKGCSPGSKPAAVCPDDKGIIYTEIKELERLEIHFFDAEALNSNPAGSKISSAHAGSQMLNFTPLPIGSTLDRERCVFYWQPGPGFLGEYRLVFVEKSFAGEMNRKIVHVAVLPKFLPPKVIPISPPLKKVLKTR